MKQEKSHKHTSNNPNIHIKDSKQALRQSTSNSNTNSTSQTHTSIRQWLTRIYYVFLCSLLTTPFAFADLTTLTSKVKTELRDTATSVMSVLNTVIGSIGVIYVIIIGLIFVFKPDTFKENSKVLIGALVALGALYGITKYSIGVFLT